MSAIPPPEEGKVLVRGAEVFKEQLSKIERRVLSNDELIKVFTPLFDEVEKEKKKTTKGTLLARAEEYSTRHPLPAYGYPQSYMRIIAGEITRTQFVGMLTQTKT